MKILDIWTHFLLLQTISIETKQIQLNYSLTVIATRNITYIINKHYIVIIENYNYYTINVFEELYNLLILYYSFFNLSTFI